MTPPIGGLIRRLRGAPASPAPSSDRAPSPSPARSPRPPGPPANGSSGPTANASTDSVKASGTRRGRRGGRNRNRSAEDASAAVQPPTDQPAARSSTRASRPVDRTPSTSSTREGSTREGYQWGRRVEAGAADERSRQANRRRRDVRNRQLEQPLPEDIAFRPGTEGGDSSILPSRRRRPAGLHDTARILVGGARTLGGAWVKRNGDTPHADEPPSPIPPPDEVEDIPPLALAVEAIEDDAAAVETGDDAEDRPRRRRSRRGGRGRRRSGEASAEDVAELQPESSELESEADELTEIASSDSLEEAPAEETPKIARRRSPAARRQPAALEPVSDEQLSPAFAALGVSRINLETLARFGFATPTPIQEAAIPVLIANRDVVGIARTGSGKTIAFGVPMMERLDPSLDEIQGLVLVPTRELAQQVLDVLRELGAPWGLDAVGLLGGHSMQADFRALEARPHVVVGTPGRILDHLRRGTLSLRHVRYSVLDEADQMLDIGFLPDIRRILSRTPQRRQTALFSATMPGSIKRLIWQFMTDPETVRVDAESTTVDTIEQIYFEVAQRDKVRGLRELIERELKGRTLIFSNTKRGADHVAHQLEKDGVRVGALHGDLDQRKRDRVVQAFRDGTLDVLIATNVAARGLDIPEITHVVNYDVPQNAEEYVHRIGRTGRAGRQGKAITLVSEWDMEAFDAIRNELGVDIAREELALYGHASAS